jgi:hypothetical protein
VSDKPQDFSSQKSINAFFNAMAEELQNNKPDFEKAMKESSISEDALHQELWARVGKKLTSEDTGEAD